MNTTKTMMLCLCISMFTLVGHAQKVGKYVNQNYEKDWSFGAGFNIVDDSGVGIGGIQNPSENWNFSLPFYISAEYYLNNQFSFMAMLSTNKYKEGKYINGGYIVEGGEGSYFAVDLVSKFSFRDVLQTYAFDPYMSFGFGYTSISSYTYVTGVEIPANSNPTINGGLGFNYWFSQTWGLNLNIGWKWELSNRDVKSNQKQFALGVVYFLNN